MKSEEHRWAFTTVAVMCAFNSLECNLFVDLCFSPLVYGFSGVSEFCYFVKAWFFAIDGPMTKWTFVTGFAAGRPTHLGHGWWQSCCGAASGVFGGLVVMGPPVLPWTFRRIVPLAAWRKIHFVTYVRNQIGRLIVHIELPFTWNYVSVPVVFDVSRFSCIPIPLTTTYLKTDSL